MFQQLWNFKNFERLYLKTSIMALEYFFHYSIQFDIKTSFVFFICLLCVSL